MKITSVLRSPRRAKSSRNAAKARRRSSSLSAPSARLGAMLILGPYGAVYFGVTSFLHVPEGMAVVQRIPGIGPRKF